MSVLAIVGIAAFAGVAWIAGSAPVAAADTEHEIEFEAGAGYDGNPFLAPGDPYFDQRAGVTVVPESQSGMYVPLRLRGGSWLVRPSSRLGLEYTARGRFYPDSALDNANESYLRLEPGAIWVLGRRGFRENTLRLSPRFTYNKEVYYDRDTGLEYDNGGSSLSDRFSYTALGLEAEYRARTAERVEWGAGLLYEARDYEEIAGVSSLDQDRIEAEADVEIGLSDRVALELGVEYRIRSYDDRRARNLAGEQLATNDILEYRYFEYGATLRVRPADGWWLYLDAERRDRTDEFVGYNDYTRNSLRLRSVYDAGRVRVRGAVRAWSRDYDRAFIFDLPQNPQDLSPNPLKSYDTLDVDLRVEVPFGRRGWKVYGELDYRDQDAKDPRFAYSREEIAVGVAWSR